MCMYAVMCTDHSTKKQHREVGMLTVVTSVSIAGVLVNTLAQYVRDAGSIPALDTLFHVFIPSTMQAAATMIMLCVVRCVNLLCVCIYISCVCPLPVCM